MNIQIPMNDFMSDGYIPRVGVDRLVLSAVLSKDYYQKGGRRIGPADFEVYAGMISMLHQSDNLKYIPPKSHKGPSGKHHACHRHVLSIAGRHVMTVRRGIQGSNPYLNFEMNPDKLKEPDFAIICKEIFEILPPEITREQFLLSTAISSIELFIDLPGISHCAIETLVPAKHHPKKISHGSTEYDGGRESRIVVAKYDKARQLKEKEGVQLDHSLTRIEIRVRERRTSLLELLNAEEVAFYKGIFRNLTRQTGHVMQRVRTGGVVPFPSRGTHVADQREPTDALHAVKVPQQSTATLLVQSLEAMAATAGVPPNICKQAAYPCVQLIAQSTPSAPQLAQSISPNFKGVQ